MVRCGDCKYRAVWGNMRANSGGAAFPMDFDLVLRDVRLADAKPDQPATDIGVKDGRIAAIAPRLGGSAKEQLQEWTLAPRPAANFRRSTGPPTGHFALSGQPTAPIASATILACLR
jgi:hypothetical protein